MDHRPPRPDQPYSWDDERLSAYLDGELSAPEQAQLEARLVVDPELRQLVDELRAVRQQLEILPEYRLQSTFAEQVLRRAEQEMLLSPVACETSSVSTTAATTAIPAVSAASPEPAVVPLFHPSTARRWQRGAIWTAIAAAAVLLLIVTNRPLDPELDHIARHDPNTRVTVEHGAAKTTPDNTKNAATHNDPVSQEQLQPDRQRVTGQSATEVLRGQVESQGKPEQLAPPNALSNQDPTAAARPVDTRMAKSDLNFSKSAAGSQQENPAQQGSDAQPQVIAGNDKRKMDAAERKMLLKNQTPASPTPFSDKQANPRGEVVTPELANLLASEEFSRLARPTANGNNEIERESADEQVLVVYVTPHTDAKSDQAFESLLANNSIQLTDKVLDLDGTERRQTFFTQPAPASPAVEPLSKPFSSKARRDELKDRKSTDADRSEKSASALGAAEMAKSPGAAPEIASSMQHDPSQGNELYYLEADEAQVQELLRQLRVAPDRFARLSVATGEIPVAGVRDFLLREDGLDQKASPASADLNRGAASAASEPRGADQTSEKKQLEQQQLALQAPAAPPRGAPAINAPTPAVEAEALSQTAQAVPAPAKAVQSPLPSNLEPSVPQSTVQQSNAPQPSAPLAKAAPAPAEPRLPVTPSGDSLSPQAGAFSAQPRTEQTQDSLATADARSNRRSLATDQEVPTTSGPLIAYRLRGLDKINTASSTQAANPDPQPGGNAGGGAGLANAAQGTVTFGAARGGGTSDKGIPLLKATAKPKAESNADVQPPSQNAVPSIANSSGDLPTPGLSNGAAGTTPSDAKQAADEPLSRALTRSKENEVSKAEEKGSAEAVQKKVAAPKRVRVLFVIEREPLE